MATVYGSLVNSVWRAYLDYSATNTSNTVTTVTVTAGINIPTSGYRTTRSYKSTVNVGANMASGTLSEATRYGTLTTAIVSKSYAYTRTHAAQTITISSKLVTPKSGTVSYSSTPANVTVTIPARPSYSVSFNANGGSGAPSAQTKWYDETLTLTTGKPTRTGYTFQGWATSATGGVAYASGGSYTANAGATLYAVWKANTVTISYNANGGSGSIASQTKTYGQTLTLSNGAGFTRTLHSLIGWNTASDGTGTAYSLSQVLGTTFLTAMTLYAQWHLDYIRPIISNFVCYRSNSSGVAADDGQYIYIAFDYTGGSIDGGETHIAPTIKITVDNTSPIYEATQSGGTGTFSQVYGTYTENNSHTVVVKAWDSNDTTGTTVTVTVPSATFPIDILADGSGMGIMTPAVAGQTLKIFVDAIYPVGSYYETSDSSFDPNTYFGGTWVLETAGQVHVSAGTGYTIGATGGATTSETGNHTLTTTEIPAHTHNSKTLTGGINLRQNAVTGGASGIVANTDTAWSGTHSTLSAPSASNPIYHHLTITATHTHDSVGGGGSHNHGPVSTMQPYIVVNRWHRTA